VTDLINFTFIKYRTVTVQHFNTALYGKPFERAALSLFGVLMKWKAVVVVVFAVLSGFMMALGFNTLDWMTHQNPPEFWSFIWTPQGGTLTMPFWYGYFFGGILPLWGGGFLAGIIVGLLLRLKKSQ
jgi:hypothetical protein